MSAIQGLAAIAIDCPEGPTLLANWWAGLIGGTVKSDRDGDASLEAEGFPRFDFLRTPDVKKGKNRLHLDLYSNDLEAAVEEALAHGATRADDVYQGRGWHVLRDPQGNEFCILPPPRKD